jgi:hypothetical protein
MNIQLVMQILNLVQALASSFLKQNSKGMTYMAISATLVQIAQITNQVYEQHTGKPMDLSLIKGENPV